MVLATTIYFIFGGFLTKDSAYLALINMLALSEMLMQMAVAQIPQDNQVFVRRHEILRSKAEATIAAMKAEASAAAANL